MNEIRLKSDIKSLRFVEIGSRLLAYAVCIELLLASAVIVYQSYGDLLDLAIDKSIQSGLSVLILLEMFYVVRSFIKYGSINVGLVISVGMIAAVKELIFQLDSITLQIGIAFSLLFLALAAVYYIEFMVFEKYKKEKKQAHIERSST
jgi:uncharacterized membrane protein (DUF373 family)